MGEGYYRSANVIEDPTKKDMQGNYLELGDLLYSLYKADISCHPAHASEPDQKHLCWLTEM